MKKNMFGGFMMIMKKEHWSSGSPLFLFANLIILIISFF